MKTITLTEFKRTTGVRLSAADRDALSRLASGITIQPTLGTNDQYDLTPDSRVGLVRLPESLVEIRPKIPIDRLVFMLSYAFDTPHWRDVYADYGTASSVFEAMVPIFCRLVSKATSRGLLHGYQEREEALSTVRGRIRFHEQLASRFGIFPPIEVRFDEFTADIVENQLIRSALEVLHRLPLRSVLSSRALREILWAFQDVSTTRFGAGFLPEVRYTRLNEHYRPAISLAKLILSSMSLELPVGSATGLSFLVDMNKVFELFLHRALREALGLSEAEFPRGDSRLRLDDARQIVLRPDLSWWRAGRCIFVGDAKYKRLDAHGYRHADLSQLLAYTIAARLSVGLLVYAVGEEEPAMHDVEHLGKRLVVAALDVSGQPESVLAEVAAIASLISTLANTTSQVA